MDPNAKTIPDAGYILILGCFDTKGEDFAYLYQQLKNQGAALLTLNTGIFDTEVPFPIDYSAETIATTAGTTLAALRAKADRNRAIEKMGAGASKLIDQLCADKNILGAISMGGGGGTYIALAAMQTIPFGIPKLCLSTLASKDLSRQVGTQDITLMPSVVDVAGLNTISRLLISQAAGAIWGMARAKAELQEKKKGTIAISMFGNTTTCVKHCTALLEAQGYEVLAFHAVGTGGRTMEYLIREGFIDGVLDITTTELADELCEGICSAGPDRLTAAAQMGIPQVVVPGCLDMVNYGHLDTVPVRFKDRLLFSWAPDVTLMRTNAEENRLLGESIAQKLNQTKGKATVLVPSKGLSIVSKAGGVFHQPEVDQILFETIENSLKESIPFARLDTDINDERFAQMAVKSLLNIL